MYNELTTICESRKNSALSAKQHAQDSYEREQQKLNKATEELDDYILWSREEKARKYDSLIGKTVDLKTIENTNIEIANLKHKQLELEENIESIKQELQQKHEKLQSAMQFFYQCQKRLEKYSELSRLKDMRALKQNRIKEDGKLDEFIKPREHVL